MGGLCSDLSLEDRLDQHVKQQNYYSFDQILLEYYNEIVLIQNYKSKKINKHDILVTSMMDNLIDIIRDINRLPNGCLPLLCDILHMLHNHDPEIYNRYNLITKINNLYGSLQVPLLKIFLENDNLIDQYLKNPELLLRLMSNSQVLNDSINSGLLLDIIDLAINHTQFSKWSIDTKYQLLLQFEPMLIEQHVFNKIIIYKIINKIIGDNKKLSFAYAGSSSHLKIHIINFVTIEDINKIYVFNILKLFIYNMFDDEIIKLLCDSGKTIVENIKRIKKSPLDIESDDTVIKNETQKIIKKLTKISSIVN